MCGSLGLLVRLRALRRRRRLCRCCRPGRIRGCSSCCRPRGGRTSAAGAGFGRARGGSRPRRLAACGRLCGPPRLRGRSFRCLARLRVARFSLGRFFGLSRRAALGFAGLATFSGCCSLRCRFPHLFLPCWRPTCEPASQLRGDGRRFRCDLVRTEDARLPFVRAFPALGSESGGSQVAGQSQARARSVQISIAGDAGG